MPSALLFFFSGSFMIPYECKIICSVKKVMGNLIGISLNLYITLGSMAILTILIFCIVRIRIRKLKILNF